MKKDEILCPLTDNNITIDDCMENRETSEKYIPDRFKVKVNWKEICKNCKYYNY